MSSFYLGSYREEQLAVEGGAGRHVSWGHDDVPKCGAVAGRRRQIILHKWKWVQEHKPNISTAVVRQLLLERTLDHAMAAKDRKEMVLPPLSETGNGWLPLAREHRQGWGSRKVLMTGKRLPNGFKPPRSVTEHWQLGLRGWTKYLKRQRREWRTNKSWGQKETKEET